MAPYVRARRRRRYRRRGRLPGRQAAAAVAAGIILAALAHSAPGSAARAHRPGPGHGGRGVAAAAIGYARAQLGKPYCWGGVGPSCYDCSGLVMMAYLSAGITLPRTSQQQWAALPHARREHPGYLVFAPGSDGTWTSPGHVALVIGGGRVIQAYSTGVPIEVSSLSAFASGSGGIIGYADPLAGQR